MKPGRAVASFDSATGMLRCLARFLSGRDTPLLGQFPGPLEPVLTTALAGVNHLPRRLAETCYTTSGVSEAVPRHRLGELDSEELASWVVDHYPRQRYPVIFVGSSNGALVHLAAALGAPWLPQTLLVPVRRGGVDRDDAEGELRAGLDPGQDLLAANPDLRLHHMHDPNQDRLMIAGMSYSRVKWHRLPRAYAEFIRNHLESGGVLVTAECELTWPTTRVNDRHVFQFGAHGGATTEEYHGGGPRVAALLKHYGERRRSWSPPAPDGSSAEAEWGFDPALLDDLGELSRSRGNRLWRLRFDHPERLSPAVAELYRTWYSRRGIDGGRLVGESFLLVEPWWTLRSGSVPFWSAFNTRASHEALRDYLDEAAPYDEIRLMLFPHGVDSIGLAGVDEWRELAGRARKVGTLLGVDPRAYPRDFAALARSHREFARIRERYPQPRPMRLDAAVEALPRNSGLSWEEA
ncbi:hypothetical protein FHX42_002170 [Saccharopolyspora lacisalsi]|uniref:Uncharacterized protein n=1 Tax=Halosaccharopolyspora lacisalsi TaxID=1000566 RepID=A0A839DUU9_9PSEU|nr:hypothetical protein [Halosaccharopolyspora lacisalsi]MBA8824823.1 hypothetical protein [Halosaccharopolyspora lacisalsi]